MGFVMANKWRKSPEHLIATFDAVVPVDAPGVERRKMFGYPCAFVNNNMFMGLHQENMILRLPEDARATLAGYDGGGPFEPMPGRVMREYAKVPPEILEDETELTAWVGRSLAYASALPPKQKKQRKSRKKA
jgi:TfoX/Sxy family transcriptional regulator of competence genes